MVDVKLLESLNNITNINKKEEIFQLDSFINNYQSDDQYNDKIYSDIFVALISNRLNLINEKE